MIRASAAWASRSASCRCTRLLGGIDPARTLPILLDVGTDNAELLDDPMYLGWRHHRIAGADYDDFVRPVRPGRAGPSCPMSCCNGRTSPPRTPCRSWSATAISCSSFNDDIQGTAAVVLAALSAGAAATGSRLRDQTVVMLGAGSAGIGVCEQVVRSMVADGLSEQGARARVCVVDINGLLTTDRPDLDAGAAPSRPAAGRRAQQGTWPGRPHRRDRRCAPDRAHRTVDRVRGLHRRGRAPCRRAREAADHHAAVQPDQPQRGPATNLADWTEGRALIATGSPFAPVQVGDASIPVAQCNNIYIFPGIGLAVTAVRATRITDAMMTAAAAAVGDAATIRHDPHGTLLPDRAQLADIATAVARAVAKAAVADAVAPALTDDQIGQAIHRTRWLPRYQP